MVVRTRGLREPSLSRGIGAHAHAPQSVSIGRSIMSSMGRALVRDEREADGGGWPRR
jgi:hypothetical protein